MEAAHNFHMITHATFPRHGYLEKRIHKLLAHKRVLRVPGKEWFHFTPDEAINAITKVIYEKGGDLPPADNGAQIPAMEQNNESLEVASGSCF